jgi:3-deoxy-D-manno-octulosonate 8-phosphate phosphatase (KDO 8-P phosphatase)
MNVLSLFKNITTFVFDVDGVLTDSTVWLMPGGAQMRRMNIKDGYALQLAIKKNYKILVISGAESEEVRERLRKLNVTNVYMGEKDKRACLQQFIAENNLQPSEVLCMGDDVPDIEIMQMAGISCCPADAVADIRSISHYTSSFKGGKGCVRDVIEKVMKIRGDWSTDTTIKSQ